MISVVEARSRQGDLLSLPLEDDSSGFRVADIKGLDPVKATLSSSGYAGEDGEQYHSSRRGTRNLIFNVELVPDPETDTVYDLRQKLYRFFMTEIEVRLTFILENGLTVDVTGRVESCETAHFSQEPAVDISIICYRPDLVDLTPIVLPGFTTSDNEVSMNIDYKGTVETGIKVVLNVDRSLPDFSIHHIPANDSIRSLEFDNVPLLAGDVLTINTNQGNKEITLVRDGVGSSVLYGAAPQSNWFELMPGLNLFRIYAAGDPVPYEVEYLNKYGGL